MIATYTYADFLERKSQVGTAHGFAPLWLPDYLHKQFGMTKQEVMIPTFIVYGVAIFGSIYGGTIPMTLMKKGLDAYRARMTAMLILAVCPLAVISTQYFGDVARFGGMASWLAVGVICIGAAASWVGAG